MHGACIIYDYKSTIRSRLWSCRLLAFFRHFIFLLLQIDFLFIRHLSFLFKTFYWDSQHYQRRLRTPGASKSNVTDIKPQQALLAFRVGWGEVHMALRIEGKKKNCTWNTCNNWTVLITNRLEWEQCNLLLNWESNFNMSKHSLECYQDNFFFFV